MTPSRRKTNANAIDNAELVWIAEGEFTLGSSDVDIAAILRRHPDWRADWFAREKPQRLVTLPGFWMYRYPVTVAQFRACCAATGWTMPDAPAWEWQDDHPVVNVSWQDVNHYAEWAQAVIPTEEQWEKAARSADGRAWPWGNTWTPDFCTNATNADTTQPVGLHPENVSPYGVMDMAGNVWEWCVASPTGEYDRPPTRHPQRHAPATSGRVLRGGSWQSTYGAYFRCAFRCFECDTQRGLAAYRRPTTGFRCAVLSQG